jgi:hypothetical protein
MSGPGRVARALRQHGFTPLPRRGGRWRFEGRLRWKGGAVSAQVEIEDWEFNDCPVIRLDRDELDAGLLPHVSAAGYFCYLTPGAVVLDRDRPDHAVLQCLHQAGDVLGRLMSDQAYRQAEFSREFAANWTVGEFPIAKGVLLGSVDLGAQTVAGYWVGENEDRWLMLTESAEEAKALCDVRRWPTPSPFRGTCWLLRSAHPPPWSDEGLPKTVKAWFAWIKHWDPKVYAKVQEILSGRAYLEQPEILFLMQCPTGWVGVEIALDAVKRRAFKRKPSLLRQHFHARGSTHPIKRLSVMEVGADYVHSRNVVGQASLKDKRVVLIGCGAIGGYLAQALVKLGAGRGKGQLRLVDPDKLMPGNLGRHLLGFESIFLPKAQAMADALVRMFPGVAIRSLVREADTGADLDADLVIDATGEEALSLTLNAARLNMQNAPPVLHAWIKGNGECVQALLAESRKHACFRCLRTLDRKERFPVALPEREMRIIGCNAFTPYAVSAPMNAAGLATDLVIAWLEGKPSPRFRTRALEGSAARQVKNHDPAPLAQCPACA